MSNTETEAATTEAGLIAAVSKIAKEVEYADFHSTPDACPLGTLAAGLNYGDLRVIADALSRHTEKPSTPPPVTVGEIGKIIRREMQDHSIPAVQRSERAAQIILSASLVLPPSVEKIAEIICDGTVASCCKKNPEKYSPCTTENCRPTRQAQAILSLITKAGVVEPAGQQRAVAQTCFECDEPLHGPFCPTCNPEMGAPDRSDDAWLYRDALHELVRLKAQQDIGCVPPPTTAQWTKAWAEAEELVRIEP